MLLAQLTPSSREAVNPSLAPGSVDVDSSSPSDESDSENSDGGAGGAPPGPDPVAASQGQFLMPGDAGNVDNPSPGVMSRNSDYDNASLSETSRPKRNWLGLRRRKAPASAATDASPVSFPTAVKSGILSGYLFKNFEQRGPAIAKSKLKERWHKRWFVLDLQSSILYYYKQELRSSNLKRVPARGWIDLNRADTAIVMHAGSVRAPTRYVFQVLFTSPDLMGVQVLKLCASSQSEFTEWNDAISYAINRNARRGTKPPRASRRIVNQSDDSGTNDYNTAPSGDDASPSREPMATIQTDHLTPAPPSPVPASPMTGSSGFSGSHQIRHSSLPPGASPPGLGGGYRPPPPHMSDGPVLLGSSLNAKPEKKGALAKMARKLGLSPAIADKMWLLVVFNLVLLILSHLNDLPFWFMMMMVNAGAAYVLMGHKEDEEQKFEATRRKSVIRVSGVAPPPESLLAPTLDVASDAEPLTVVNVSDDDEPSEKEGMEDFASDQGFSPRMNPTSLFPPSSSLTMPPAASPPTSPPPAPRLPTSPPPAAQSSARFRHVAGKTFQMKSRAQLEANRHCWVPIDGSTFQVRVGPDYRKNKLKADSKGHLTTIMSVDVFKTPRKISHVAPEIQMPDATTNPTEIGHLIVINFQIPLYAPSNPLWGEKQGDGEGLSIVIVLNIPPDTYRACQTATSGALELLNRWLTAYKLPNPNSIYERFKLIGRCANPNDPNLQFSGTCARLVQNYNAKPVLTRPQHTIYHTPNYTEIDVDVHQFSYVARLGLSGFLPKLNHIIMDMAFVIEAETNSELPEVVLGCATLDRMDISKVGPW